MKITKFGHCSMLAEGKIRVLTDPGAYTLDTEQNNVKNIDVVLITHEHADHFHVESLKKILANNPDVAIITNSSVDALLKKEGINNATIIENGDQKEVKGLMFTSFGKDHAVIYREWPVVQNTSYLIGERFFYPGDAFCNPKVKVDVLALPVAGPWMKISEALDYAIDVHPEICFGVHDGMLNELGGNLVKRLAPTILEKHGIKYITLELGKETEI